MNNITFDCSLFQANDPELAKKVDEICRKEIGLVDLSNIRLPWAQAKALVQRRGKLYNMMKDLKTYMENSRSYSYRNTHIYVFNDTLTDQSSFQKFYSLLKHIINVWKNAKKTTEMWKVKYGVFGSES